MSTFITRIIAFINHGANCSAGILAGFNDCRRLISGSSFDRNLSLRTMAAIFKCSHWITRNPLFLIRLLRNRLNLLTTVNYATINWIYPFDWNQTTLSDFILKLFILYWKKQKAYLLDQNLVRELIKRVYCLIFVYREFL